MLKTLTAIERDGFDVDELFDYETTDEFEDEKTKIEITFERLNGEFEAMEFDVNDDEYDDISWGDLPERILKEWRRKHRRAIINDWAACECGTHKDIRTWRYA